MVMSAFVAQAVPLMRVSASALPDISSVSEIFGQVKSNALVLTVLLVVVFFQVERDVHGNLLDEATCEMCNGNGSAFSVPNSSGDRYRHRTCTHLRI